ncbi:MAG: hypothetical protein H7256_03415 [Bdellovibrio sp.]|nr:hypothetical protein [Bdellovibrio sp.]
MGTSAWSLTMVLVIIVSATAFGKVTSVDAAVVKAEPSKFAAEWRVSLSGTDYNDEKNKSKFVNFNLDLKTTYILTPVLIFDFQPSVKLLSGQTQTIDGADRMENRIVLSQAAIRYAPADFFAFAAGALNQRALHTPLLVDDIAFPAARIESMYRNNEFATGIGIESAIPTSTSLSANTKELEPSPSLNSAALIFSWQKNRNSKVRASVGYFAYNNLPSAVAQQSLLLGNDVQQLSEAQYSFMYQFQGLEAGLELQLPLMTLFDVIADASYLHNDKAPSGYSDASSYNLGGLFHLSKGTDWSVQGGYFSVAPDAAVAYFNANNFETNRVGYNIQSFIHFIKEGFKFGVIYMDSNLMYISPVQYREKTLILKLETNYEKI